jgi:hypothetical protein
MNPVREGFYELVSLLEKHIRCHTFNTQANRVAIVFSITTRIFNPIQVLDGHISPLSIDTHD